MVLKSTSLDGLLSSKHHQLLDSIDSLRSQGISHYISLPQIIVCGDQSSGKSSVLEAISGVPFPVKSNLCTRFPTELVLRKTQHTGVNVSIIPHHSRSDADKTSLAKFRESLDDFEKLPALIDAAKTAMGIVTLGNAFSKDLLRIEVSGPDRPQLTIVDLPGLIHSENRHQSADDVSLINEVVQTYMKEPRSIILAVVSAKNDYANQIVLKLAREADRHGKRTMGVITKPDTLLPGSESQKDYIALAKNLDVEFRLGWHVLRNTDSEAGTWSLSQRDAQEASFFASGFWATLPASSLGIESLRIRLSKVLFQQIAAELPSLLDEIKAKSEESQRALDKLGKPRITLDEQKLFLLQISQSFQTLIKAAIDGTYNDPFFGDALSITGYKKRFRAVVQELSDEFAKSLHQYGHRHKALLNGNFMNDGTSNSSELTDRVMKLMNRSRGRELPGMFNPVVVADLFKEQCSPWADIAQNHVKAVWNAAIEFLKFLVLHVSDISTTKAILATVIEPKLDEMLEAQRSKTSELLKPHQEGHPITYHQSLFKTLQEMRSKRQSEALSEAIEGYFGRSAGIYDGTVNMDTLHSQLLRSTEESDAKKHAASEAIDYVRIARDRFIDDMAVEVTEGCLVAELGSILEPMAILTMPASTITQIAGETEQSRAARAELQKKLQILAQGISICKQYAELELSGSQEEDEEDQDELTPAPATPEVAQVDVSDFTVITPSPSISKVAVDAEVKPDPVVSKAAANFENILFTSVSDEPQSPCRDEMPSVDDWGVLKSSKKKKKGKRIASSEPLPEPLPVKPEPEPEMSTNIWNGYV
ncbi:hypothetical protein S40288_00703 [Stachybotrys chartarum IBT 40288]|nr:hypothetical protein S40288_00703 [Stachybotrys chartarum IBT 40288]